MFGFGLKNDQYNKEGIVPKFTDVVIMNPTACWGKFRDLFHENNKELICSMATAVCTEPVYDYTKNKHTSIKHEKLKN